MKTSPPFPLIEVDEGLRNLAHSFLKKERQSGNVLCLRNPPKAREWKLSKAISYWMFRRTDVADYIVSIIQKKGKKP